VVPLPPPPLSYEEVLVEEMEVVRRSYSPPPLVRPPRCWWRGRYDKVVPLLLPPQPWPWPLTPLPVSLLVGATGAAAVPLPLHPLLAASADAPAAAGAGAGAAAPAAAALPLPPLLMLLLPRLLPLAPYEEVLVVEVDARVVRRSYFPALVCPPVLVVVVTRFGGRAQHLHTRCRRKQFI
jgi:hypothetical protein